MAWKYIILCFSFLIVQCISAFADPLTEVMIDEIEKKTSQIESSKVIYIIKIGEAYQSKNISYWDINKGVKVVTSDSKGEKIRLLDSEEFLFYNPDRNMLNKIKIGELGKKFNSQLIRAILCWGLIIPARPFWNKEVKNLKYTQIGKSDGENAYIFLYKVPGIKNNKLFYSNSKIWVRVKDGIWLKEVIYNEEGREIMEAKLVEVDINPQLNEGFLSVSPSEDFKVNDLTDIWIKKLSDLGL